MKSIGLTAVCSGCALLGSAFVVATRLLRDGCQGYAHCTTSVALVGLLTLVVGLLISAVLLLVRNALGEAAVLPKQHASWPFVAAVIGIGLGASWALW